MNIENTKAIKVTYIISFLIAIFGSIQQILIHVYLTPTYVKLFNNMGARLPNLTLLLINYKSFYLYFFIFILTFLIVKEFIFKDKSIKIIINIVPMFLFILHTFFVLFAFYLPFMNVLLSSN